MNFIFLQKHKLSCNPDLSWVLSVWLILISDIFFLQSNSPNTSKMTFCDIGAIRVLSVMCSWTTTGADPSNDPGIPVWIDYWVNLQCTHYIKHDILCNTNVLLYFFDMYVNQHLMSNVNWNYNSFKPSKSTQFVNWLSNSYWCVGDCCLNGFGYAQTSSLNPEAKGLDFSFRMNQSALWQ